RSKSTDKISWEEVLESPSIQRDQSLVRTIDNQAVFTMVFPPTDGVVRNGNGYRTDSEDDFQLINAGNPIRIIQEDSDDQVTDRDIRYEVYDRNVGLVAEYDEVLTYCSRNDCLGDMLIDSGFKVLMTLTDHGKD